jgi:hypothetical protein
MQEEWRERARKSQSWLVTTMSVCFSDSQNYIFNFIIIILLCYKIINKEIKKEESNF